MQIRDLLSNSATLKVKLGTVPYLEIGDVNIENKTYKLKDKGAVSGAVFATKNTILVSTVRPTRGAITIIKENSIAVSGAFVCLKTKESICLHRYLFYIVNAKRFTSYLGMNSKGATYPTCSKDDVLNFSDFNLPSISEQQSIVATLDKINELIDANKSQLELLDEAVKSRFVEMFGNPKTNSKRLPLVKPEEICESISAGGDRPNEVSSIRTEDFLYPIFSNGEKDDGLYGWSKGYRIGKPAVTISGRGTIGYTSFRKDGKFTPIVRLIVMIPNEKINPIYLTYYMNLEREIGSGSGVQQLTVPMVKEKSIILPDIVEQNNFALLVEQVDKLKFDLQKHNELLTELLNKKMDEYFGGDM